MKKFLFLLSFMITIPLSIMAYDVMVDGIYYNLNTAEKTAEVTYESAYYYTNPSNPNIKYTVYHSGYTGDVVVPATFQYNGETFQVRSVGERAFCDFGNTTTSTITSVSLPEGITSIGNYAFNDCKSMTSVNIPDGVTSIGNSAFIDCKSMTSVNIPDGVTSIGGAAFYNCESITSIVIPNSVTSMGVNTFNGCKGLTSVEIGSGLTALSAGTFTSTGLTSVIIPNNITSIGEDAFSRCSNLTNVEIGSGVTEILQEAFSVCGKLKNVTCHALVPPKVNQLYNGNFSNVKDGVLRVPLDVVDAYSAANVWKNFGTIDGFKYEYCFVSDDKSLLTFCVDCNRYARTGKTYSLNTSGDPEWLENASTITKVMFEPTFVECLPSTTVSWFKGMNNLVEIEGLEYLKTDEVKSMSWMFYDCSSLEEIDISNFNTDKVTDMTAMFYKCNSLKYLDFGSFNTANVISMASMFRECENLESLDLSSFNTDKLRNLFATFTSCKKMEQVDVSSFNTASVVTMEHLFDGCTNLVQLDLSSFDLSSIPNVYYTGIMLRNCYSLSKLTLPLSMSNINDLACSGIGTDANPCFLYVPGSFDFGDTDTSTGRFQWKGGKFQFMKDDSCVRLTVSAAGVATYCSPFDLDFSQWKETGELKAYTIGGYDKVNKSVYAMRVYDVPAGTGLYLVGNPADYDVPVTTSGSFYVNMLVGTFVSITLQPTDGDYTNFILYGTSPADACFRPTTGGPLKGNRAYLQIPTAMLSSNANSLNIVFDDETDGINEVAAASEKNAWYTLDGRKLNGAPVQKGIYINGGRKVMVK